MPWYKSGTVSVTQNSNAVIGTGTAFIANSRVGDAFRGPDGAWYEVTNIASDTAMSISPNYQGATNASGTYALAPMQGYVKDSADALRALVNQYGSKLAALGTTGNYETLPISKGGTGGTTQAAAQSGLGLVPTSSRLDVTAGRIVKVGDYGRNGGANIVQASTVDANTLSVPASYIFNGGGINVPESAYLDHFTHAVAGYSKQYAMGMLTDNCYVRTQNNNTFGSWRQFVTTVPGAPIAVAQGGTGGATAAAGRSGLGAAASGANGDITQLSGLTVALSVAQGGTGAGTSGGALANLGAMPLAGSSSSNPDFASAKVSANRSNIASQGLYLLWNEGSGGLSGAGSFVCNQGGGSGGFSWRSINAANTLSGPVMTYTYAGNLNVPGTVSQGSDRRLKTNDVEILDGLDRILQIRPVEFDRRDFLDSTEYPHHEVGVIAQELYEITPLLVTPAKPDIEEDIWRVNYTGLIPYLVSAIKTLKAEIEELKAAAK
ncbi:tail fiber domain-containing protein [Pseudomonas helmanticensis]|uniref:tail fiber domain-containing protein n=1 Tax=Pseudomonas TaxID=286 RepID=UPI00235F2347|nr:tail fiber domain-containing protein [Pseudomonas sp. TNT2022 ID642]MDD1002451.1 tail fiber domain-containing protein [Pseudomonas sp. TNT2022 ID642]